MWPTLGNENNGLHFGDLSLITGTGGLKSGRGGPQYLHSVCQTVRISVLKFAEKGVFKISMSANLGKRGLSWTENSRKSEERVLICCTMISYLDS